MAPSLLNLPGELRNRIYEFVAEDEGTPVKIKHIKNEHDKVNGEGREVVADDKVTGKDLPTAGTYAGLTRVCRQVREEFLPIHQGSACVLLHSGDLEVWIQTFDSTDNIPAREVYIRFPLDSDEDVVADDVGQLLETQPLFMMQYQFIWWSRRMLAPANNNYICFRFVHHARAYPVLINYETKSVEIGLARRALDL